MNDNFAQTYMTIIGIAFCTLCLSFAVIELARMLFKAYYKARQDVVDAAMNYESTKEFEIRQRLMGK